MENLAANAKLRAAAVISDISHPLYLAPPAILAVSLRSSNGVAAGLYWWGLYLVFSTFLPLVDLIWRRNSGRISDWHISNRQERTWPLVFGMVYAGAGFAVFRVLSAPLILQASLLAGLAMSVMVIPITCFWKISLHLMGNTSLAVILYMGFRLHPFSPGVFIMAFFLLAVAVSRFIVKAHTVAQIVTGALLGGAVTWIIMAAMGL